MYIKRRKLNKMALSDIVDSICEELLNYNPDIMFLTSKSFVEKDTLEEIVKTPQIISSVPIKELNIPSSIKIDEDGFVRTWCDKVVLLKIVYKEISFKDGNVKEKEVKRLYLDIKD